MQDPVIIGWVWTIGALAAVAVALPLLRLAIAGTLYAIAVVSGHARLRAAAIRTLPRSAHVIGSLVVGTAAVAAPALAAERAAAEEVGLDRDGGPGGITTVRSTPSLDRAGGLTAARTPASAPTGAPSTPASTATAGRAAPHATAPGSTAAASARGTADIAPAATATPVGRPAPTGQDGGAQVTRLYIVQVGDTLWDIAQQQLDQPTDAEVTETWKAIWRANRAVIGDDPALIHPGDRLDLGGRA